MKPDNNLKKELINIRSDLFSSKVSFRGLKYDGDLYCSNQKCFREDHNELREDKIDSIILYSEMTRGKKNIGKCCKCDTKISTRI